MGRMPQAFPIKWLMSTQVRNILETYVISKCHVHAKNIVYHSNQPVKIKQTTPAKL